MHLDTVRAYPVTGRKGSKENKASQAPVGIKVRPLKLGRYGGALCSSPGWVSRRCMALWLLQSSCCSPAIHSRNIPREAVAAPAGVPAAARSALARAAAVVFTAATRAAALVPQEAPPVIALADRVRAARPGTFRVRDRHHRNRARLTPKLLTRIPRKLLKNAASSPFCAIPCGSRNPHPNPPSWWPKCGRRSVSKPRARFVPRDKCTAEADVRERSFLAVSGVSAGRENLGRTAAACSRLGIRTSVAGCA